MFIAISGIAILVGEYVGNKVTFQERQPFEGNIINDNKRIEVTIFRLTLKYGVNNYK